ncbi:MAG: hypothetical protein ACREVN_13120 [Gammaproteobacteria bacterium]
MRSRQEILGEIFGDLEKSFERGVIDILCAEDRPDPEALVIAIQDHTLRRVGPPASGAGPDDAIDLIIDALELCYYHRECATFRSALQRAKMLRVRPSDLHGRSLKDIDLLSPAEACEAKWRESRKGRKNIRQGRQERPAAEAESTAGETSVAEDDHKPERRSDSRADPVYPLRLRTLGRT